MIAVVLSRKSEDRSFKMPHEYRPDVVAYVNRHFMKAKSGAAEETLRDVSNRC